MQKYLRLASVSACLLLAPACAAQPDSVADAEAESAAVAPASEPAEQAQPAAAAPAPAAPAAQAKFVAPIRGQAELGFLNPVTKREKNGDVVTVIKVKNMSTTGAIAGLRVDENWYDKGGNPVTGDTFRYRKPMQPQEVIEITLLTPYNKAMDRNSYNFTHANGTIKTTKLPKF